MIRAFIAIKISPDEEFIRAFRVLKNQLYKEKISWVGIENLHITVRFLGNVSGETINIIKHELKKIQSIPAFNFQIDGLHLFKDHHSLRVIYSEVKAGHDLYDLAKAVDNCLLKLDLFPSEVKFLPHLTLGRIKPLKEKENLELVIHNLRNLFFQKVECNEFVLFESILMPTGPIYKPLEIFKLKQNYFPFA